MGDMVRLAHENMAFLLYGRTRDHLAHTRKAHLKKKASGSRPKASVQSRAALREGQRIQPRQVS